MYRTFLFACFFLFSTVLHADDTALKKAILQQLAKHTAQQFHFVQTKKIAVLEKPLITEGTLALDGNNTVIWDIQKPYALRYIITAETIREIDAQGEHTTAIGQNPIAAALTQAISSTLSGQWQDNNTLTTLVASGTMDAWVLHVTPKNTELQKLIQSLTVTGEQNNISTIVIAESNGDNTTIHLQPLKK
jgi:hypothetical protein